MHDLVVLELFWDQLLLQKALLREYDEGNVKKYYRVQEVCELFAISKNTLKKWDKNLGLQKYRVEGVVLYSHEDLVHFIESYKI